MKKYIILIPIYNDKESLAKLIENINLEVKDLNSEISIIVVNDASSQQVIDNYQNIESIHSIKFLNMKENRGHARCIASGLKYIFEKKEFDYVIPMDGDGEDRPEEIRPLIEKAKEYPDTVITANRIKRSEGLLFKFCYLIHKYLTFVFTGQSIKFGNYACLTKSAVDKMSKEAATWSSFSGSLSKVVKDRRSVPSIRGSRYFGPSKMSFINLLKHSLSIAAVYKFTVLIRSIIFLAVYIFLVSQYISVVTFIPIALVVVMIISVFVLSGRENITELNSSLENINNIDNLK